MDQAPACAKYIKPVLDRSEIESPSSLSPQVRRIRSFLVANFALLVCILLISGTMIFAISSLPAKTEAYTVRGPIVITSDSDFTPANGVVGGTGAPADPYIISGWHIILSSGTGISISDTTAYFILVDVRINGTATLTGSATGISFSSVENGQIKNSLINDTNLAVDIQWSYDGSVHGNEFLGAVGWAMNIQNSNRVHVVDNYFHGQNGIQSYRWRYSNVMLNEFLWNEMCISGSDANTLVINENIVTDCGYPVSFSSSTNLQVLNNLFVDCMYGVDLSAVSYSDISGNVIERASATGINIWSSSYEITIRDNLVNGTVVFGGVVVENSWDMEITRNMISNNTIGYGYTGGGIALLLGCSDILVYNNSFVHNMPQLAQDRGGPENRWNGTYPVGGNYWSNYTGVDLMQGPNQDVPGPDGFGDTPLVLDADSRDYYPLMTLRPKTMGPIAEFTIDPVLGDVTMTITFDGTSSYHPEPKKNITGYRWDFDCDGKFDTSLSPNPVATRMFSVSGNYTVILEVEDEDGMTDMTTQVITILEEGIIPEFGTVLAPVLAMIALVAFALRRRTPER